MPMMLPLCLGGLAWLPASGLGQEKGNYDVKVVKYDGLKEVVLQNRGKVVVVDIWGIR